LVTHPSLTRAFWVDAVVLKGWADRRAKRPAPRRMMPPPPRLVGTYKVTVKDGNKIEVEANDQVAGIGLYLTDKLADMASRSRDDGREETL